MRLLVLAARDGDLIAVGPTSKEDVADDIRDGLEAAGWTVLPQSARPVSIATFHAEYRRAVRGAR